MNISIVVPLFASCPYRRRNWKVIANELSALAEKRGDVEVIAAEHGHQHAAGLPYIQRVDVPVFTRSKARNAGWRAATAERICFCDSDMVMTLDAWEKAIEESARVDCYNPSAQCWKPGPRKTANRITTDHRYRFDLPLRGTGLKPSRANLTGGIFFTTREFLERVGGWDEDFCGWGYEDTALGILARRAGVTIATGTTVGRPIHLWHPNPKRRKGTTKVLHEKYLRSEPAREKRRRHPPIFVCPDYASRDEGHYPPINDFVAVTSLSQKPFHLPRQSVCLDTWKAFGLEIVAVNSTEEITQLRSLYPQVDHWHVCEGKTTTFEANNTPRITALTDVAITRDQPILLLNSDIEIHGAQSRLLDALAPGCLTIGIRHNYQTNWWAGGRERAGLDAFYIEPDFARSLPRLDMGVGKPAWDYWLPLHAIRSGVPTRWIGYGLFFHQSHRVLWSRKDYHAGCAELRFAYGPKANGVRQAWPFVRSYKPNNFVGIPTFKTVVPSPSRCHAVCVVAIGRASQILSKVTLARINAYADRCDADLVVLRDDQCPDFPILNKFRIGQVGQYYDRTLFIDIDVFVRNDAPNLFDLLPAGKVYRYNETPEIDVCNQETLHGGVRESRDVDSLVRTTGIRRREIKSLSTGVVLFDREHSPMWDPPESFVERFHTVEQVWVNLRSMELDLPLGELPREFNTQCWMRDYASYLDSAQFVHVAGATDKLAELERLVSAETAKQTLSHSSSSSHGAT